ncbi:hypothetical protein Q5P01_011062 [Channa striata]|uniref:Ig-like domain-containing protein n=1 Tax=Channa striata TaxID=64152 RepID=A0AA88MVQ5_CHASR|nr:hypothetical protein Q5P01_011062 [Channa striata]
MMKFCLLLAVFCSPVLSEEWKASVVKNLNALVTSCIVIPCTFNQPKDNLPSSKLRGIWHIGKDKAQIVYHDDKSRIIDNFRSRTQMLGHLGQKNCTLEITDVKDHDNGPFCFRIELVESDKPTTDKYSFVEDCVDLKMLPEPPTPLLISTKTATEGNVYIITCSVTHTCPSHVPTLSWNRKGDVIEIHREIHSGIWETQSILLFTAEVKDDHTDVSCTAQFYGRKTSSEKITVYVKSTDSYNHIIIPCAVGISITVIFTIFCVLMVKKYKLSTFQAMGHSASTSFITPTAKNLSWGCHKEDTDKLKDILFSNAASDRHGVSGLERNHVA